MNYRDPERIDVLARQFVLGTMTRRARRRFDRLIDEDSRIADRVLALEEELLPLAWSLEPVQPSDLVWRRIARQIGTGKGASDIHKRTNRWPLAAAAMFIGLMVSTFGWWRQGTQPPQVIVETVPTDPSIGVLADADGNTLWVARIYPDLQRADVAVETPPGSQPANDYQLWILRGDGVPVSMGLLPQAGDRQLDLTPGAVDALASGNVLAVSLEPLGGSPQVVPTGPVVYTAALLNP